MKYVVCYSGGHYSAIVGIEAVRKYGKENVILLNHDLCSRSELADIKRFKKEVADYLGLEITYANMPDCENLDQFDVCMGLNAFKYGIQSSALCTHELKTKPFYEWLAKNFPADPPKVREDVVIMYGFEPAEKTRITRRVGIMAAKGYKTDYPLLWQDRTIHDTEEVGIKRPAAYEIFNHGNCIGYLKAGKQHWFTVYCLYPDVWEKANQAEEAIGYSAIFRTTPCGH
ncbi:MAG: hypothetical protein LBL82_08300 [Oscillospiraceae bacterium]|jgi:hypothetical protein|nr:hypothetical protein [Oscillospiraceae bacterium]